MYIGLFFGSFNPIHIGHLIIANYMAESTPLDQVWFVVSPQNPLKKKSTLLNEYDRLHLVNLAIEENDNLRSSDIEFNLPKPSYTIDTLTYLKEKYKNHQFALIMGSDTVNTLHKWKNSEILMRDYEFYVYPRPGFLENNLLQKSNFRLVQDVPYLSISSSFIRDQIKKGISMRYLLPEMVRNYIEDMSFFK